MRKFTLILGVAAMALLASSCQKLRSRDQLNKGVQAFKNAQYADAVESFKTAVELDPNFPTARLYLATAYMQQYIPGAESPENNRMAQAAHDEFMKVLEQNPTDKVAIASLASLYLNQKKWDEAQKWYEKLAAVDPTSPIPHYSLGFIAWSKWYPAYGTARAKLGMKQEDPGPIKDKKVKEELKAQYGPVIDSGLQALDFPRSAPQNRPVMPCVDVRELSRHRIQFRKKGGRKALPSDVLFATVAVQALD